MAEVEGLREAAAGEIQKIKQQRTELQRTVEDIKTEAENLVKKIKTLRQSLLSVEGKLEDATPNVNQQQRKLTDILSVRDHVRHGLKLVYVVSCC